MTWGKRQREFRQRGLDMEELTLSIPTMPLMTSSILSWLCRSLGRKGEKQNKTTKKKTSRALTPKEVLKSLFLSQFFLFFKKRKGLLIFLHQCNKQSCYGLVLQQTTHSRAILADASDLSLCIYMYIFTHIYL